MKAYFQKHNLSYFDVKQGYFAEIAYALPLKIIRPGIISGYIFFDKNNKDGKTYTYHAIPLLLRYGNSIIKKPIVSIAASAGIYSFNEHFASQIGAITTSNSLLFGYNFQVTIDYPSNIGRAVHLGYEKIGPYQFRTLSFYLPIDPFWKLIFIPKDKNKKEPEKPSKEEPKNKRI